MLFGLVPKTLQIDNSNTVLNYCRVGNMENLWKHSYEANLSLKPKLVQKRKLINKDATFEINIKLYVAATYDIMTEKGL